MDLANDFFSPLQLKKQFHAANKDKEAMVMKYALGERDVIVQRNGKEAAEKNLKQALKEKDDLNAKFKALQTEKGKVQQLADSRVKRTLSQPFLD